jgi:hypothetical protein
VAVLCCNESEAGGKVFTAKIYICPKGPSVQIMCDRFREYFNKQPPTKRTVMLVEQIRETRSDLTLCKVHSGRTRTYTHNKNMGKLLTVAENKAYRHVAKEQESKRTSRHELCARRS